MFDELSRLASKNIPFLFYTDFKGERLHVVLLSQLQKADIEYQFSSLSSASGPQKQLHKKPLPFEDYREKFDQVIEHIKNGDTYLLNLTQPTPVESPMNLKEIYETARAPFKLRVGDEFVCFSPESFVEIAQERIFTYPMKGTIDASLPDAEEKILSDKKEMAEHVMVVDLLRNDLGIVAKEIKVERFRYVQKIPAGDKELLQVSSTISGRLNENWETELGDILKALLPAGSISGTPKKRTVEIIEEVEGYERGYFTGVFGVYKDRCLKSAVMIRFIEQSSEGLLYKSGGGITLDSDVLKEYEELLDKVYIP